MGNQAQRCAVFGRMFPHRFCSQTSNRFIYAAHKLTARFPSRTVLIAYLEIGGTKNRGPMPSGTCNWITEFYVDVIKTAKKNGRSTGFMIEGNRNFRESLIEGCCNDVTMPCLTLNFMRAARLAFSAALHSRNN